MTARTIRAVAGTIANGAALSGAIDVSQGRLCALVMPGVWTANSITFQASIDNGVSFANVYDDATERTIASASAQAGRLLALDGYDWAGFTHIKIRSGTSGAPGNQGQDTTLNLSLEVPPC